MAHPLFARLDRQLELVKRELANAVEADRRFYTGIESILEAVGNEIDDYTPRGDASHAALVDGMAIELKSIRPPVLSDRTRELMHELRKFRHVARHKYALQLRRRDVARNFAIAKKLVPAFERDWRRFAKAMLAKT